MKISEWSYVVWRETLNVSADRWPVRLGHMRRMGVDRGHNVWKEVRR